MRYVCLSHIRAMTRDSLIVRLKSAEAALRARGVDHAALFGSVARGEAGPASEIDIVIVVDIAPDAELDMFAYMGIVHMGKDMFPGPVDVSVTGARRITTPTT